MILGREYRRVRNLHVVDLSLPPSLFHALCLFPPPGELSEWGDPEQSQVCPPWGWIPAHLYPCPKVWSEWSEPASCLRLPEGQAPLPLWWPTFPYDRSQVHHLEPGVPLRCVLELWEVPYWARGGALPTLQPHLPHHQHWAWHQAPPQSCHIGTSCSAHRSTPSIPWASFLRIWCAFRRHGWPKLSLGISLLHWRALPLQSACFLSIPKPSGWWFNSRLQDFGGLWAFTEWWHLPKPVWTVSEKREGPRVSLPDGSNKGQVWKWPGSLCLLLWQPIEGCYKTAGGTMEKGAHKEGDSDQGDTLITV